MQVKNLGTNFFDIIEKAIAEIVEKPDLWPEIEQGMQILRLSTHRAGAGRI